MLDSLRKSDLTASPKLHTYALRFIFKSCRNEQESNVRYSELNPEIKKLLTEAEWDDAKSWKETYDLGDDLPQETVLLLPNPVEGFTGLRTRLAELSASKAQLAVDLKSVSKKMDDLGNQEVEVRKKMDLVRRNQTRLRLRVLEVCKSIDLDFTYKLRNPENDEEGNLREELRDQIQSLQSVEQVQPKMVDLVQRVEELTRRTAVNNFTEKWRDEGGNEMNPADQIATVTKIMGELKFIQHAVSQRTEELSKFKSYVATAQETLRELSFIN